MPATLETVGMDHGCCFSSHSFPLLFFRYPYIRTTTYIPFHYYYLYYRTKVGGDWSKYVIGCGIGWIAGSKFHCRRQKKKLDSKHKTDQKALYTQYYNDVYTLQQQNAELVQALEQMGVKLR